MTRPDFEESRQHYPGEACSEYLADPDRIGCGTRGTGTGPIEWLLRGLLILALVVAAAALVASLP